MRDKRKFFTGIALVLLLSIGSGWLLLSSNNQEPTTSAFQSTPKSNEVENKEQSGDRTNDLITSVHLDVPFSSQAPHANWDDPWQEACEEMSVIMVDHFLQGSQLDPEIANTDLLAFVAWQTRNGYPEDVSIEELSVIVQQYYGYETRVLTEVTVDTITKELIKGNPVIVPAAGRKLGNPYFSGEGPWYHMLVVTGFDTTHFITNDPGTRRGEEYRYEYAVLLNAIHDWTGVKEEIEQGPRRGLIIDANRSSDS